MPPPLPPFERKIRGGWDGRKEDTNSWLRWTNQQLPHVYPCSLQDLVLARARRGDADLRSMPCLQECVRGFSLQTELILSQFPIPTCRILSTDKPCFVRNCVCGGPFLRLRTKLPFLWGGVTSSTDKTTLFVTFCFVLFYGLACSFFFSVFLRRLLLCCVLDSRFSIFGSVSFCAERFI